LPVAVVKHPLRAVLAVLVTSAAVAPVSTASAAGLSGLLDARYCESGELRVRDTNTLDGQSGRLSVSGFARY
jgi:hypothetical protein